MSLRTQFFPKWRSAFLLGACVFLSRVPGWADYQTDVGHTRLQADLGGALPTGSGVEVTQVEADNGSGAYLPDAASAEFAGKTITGKSGASAVSAHAFSVGVYYYGLTASLAPGVATVDVYEANKWLGTGFLRPSSTPPGVEPPNIESRAIQNHSWIGSVDNGGVMDSDRLRRFDFAIQRDDFLAVVGLNNGSGTAIPSLLANSYNAIAVGLSNGGHSSGTTTVDGAGRVKPEIVSPLDQTSFATPTVSAAAALLLQKAESSQALADARKSVTLKALLLAGATKSQFPGWNRTTARPLDAHFGAGQLNVYNSYRILVSGRQPASTATTVKTRGWDFAATTGASKLYFFEIAAGNTAPRFSAILTWNRMVPDQWPSLTVPVPAPDLSLKLFAAASGFSLGTLLDSSMSTVDNVEHLYESNLPPGRYALAVSSDQSGIDYGLAWFSVQTVSVIASAPAASEQGGAPGTYTITRAGDTTAPLTVNYVIGGTATNGADYQPVSASITIPANATAATITITPIVDSFAEGDETVTLSLANDLAYAFDDAATATITLHDRPLDAWRFSNFSQAELNDAAISGYLSDAEGDRVVNLLEYALELEPKIPDANSLPAVERAPNGVLTLSYTRKKSATDIAYIVELSTDLTNWNSGPAYTSVIRTIDGATTETIKAASLSSAPNQFMRLRVTRL